MKDSWKNPMMLFLSLSVLWLMLTGSLEPSSIAAGSIISIFIVRLTWEPLMMGGRQVTAHPSPPLIIHPLEAFRFFPRFLYDILKASAEVAFIALRPRISITPGIVRIDTHIRNKTALVFLANYITLTPGTLTVDLDISRHDLFIHSLDLDSLDASSLRDDVRSIEGILGGVFE